MDDPEVKPTRRIMWANDPLEQYDSSPTARKQLVEGRSDGDVKEPGSMRGKFPFAELHLGKSFAFTLPIIKENSLRSAAATFNKAQQSTGEGKRIVIIKHNETSIEAARVA